MKKNVLRVSLGLNLIGLIILLLLIYKYGLINKVFPTSGEYVVNKQFEQRETMFEALQPKNIDAVFIGDSITEKGNWNEFFPNIKTANRGIGSDTTEGILKRLDNIISLNPKKVFIMVGVNDLALNIKKDTIINNYDSIIKTLKTKIPNTALYIQSVLPVNSSGSKINNQDIDNLNIRIKELANKYSFDYIDINSKLKENEQLNNDYTIDGIHLKGNAYEIWVNNIKFFIYN